MAFSPSTPLFCNEYPYLSSKHCSPKRKLCTHFAAISHPFFLRLWQIPICFLSLWIYQFWLFHISGIIPFVASYVWLLSLRVMISRFIHTEACIDTSLFSGWIIFYIYISHFLYQITYIYMLGLLILSPGHRVSFINYIKFTFFVFQIEWSLVIFKFTDSLVL